MTAQLTRREVLRLAGGLLTSPLMACASEGGPAERLDSLARPAPAEPWPPGLNPLGLGGERDGVVLVPARPGPRPLVVLLHGAGGAGRRVARLLAPAAQATGCLVVAPDSRALTWDAVTGDFGADVAYLSRVLTRVFARCAVDVGAPPIFVSHAAPTPSCGSRPAAAAWCRPATARLRRALSRVRRQSRLPSRDCRRGHGLAARASLTPTFSDLRR
ncbi:MAG: hypothetical protein ACTHM9_10780 [Gemmatimonadales bacterium]